MGATPASGISVDGASPLGSTLNAPLLQMTWYAVIIQAAADWGARLPFKPVFGKVLGLWDLS